MNRSLKFAVGAALSAAVAGVAVLPAASSAHRPGRDHGGRDRHGAIRHVLLISVDGLHQSDLDWYVAHHPGSELAKLANGGAEYTNAHTSDPSDSDPGGTALMTGGDPRATGVYYDVEYNHNLYEAGTTACHGPTGADVIYDSPDDIDATRLDAGQGIPGLQSDPSKILQMTGNPQTVLNPATFPVDPKSCQPIWPHSYLKVNTMFEVAKRAGLRTAWSDKHPVYESFNGPSGSGIDDLFTPEIDSTAIEPNGTPYPGDISWTGDNAATRQYDSYKVQAILNEIDGHDHTGTGPRVGVPAIFGMNFQTVSTAEKLLSSEAVIGGPVLPGGYLPGTTTPGPLLSSALDYINAQLQTLDQEIQRQGIARTTRDHHHRKARAIAAGSQPADADQGRPDHRCDQRGMDGGSPRRRQPDRRRHRRRPVAELPVRPLPASGRLRRGLPVEPPGDGRDLQRRHANACPLWPGEDLRREGGGPLLRGAGG